MDQNPNELFPEKMRTFLGEKKTKEILLEILLLILSQNQELYFTRIFVYLFKTLEMVREEYLRHRSLKLIIGRLSYFIFMRSGLTEIFFVIIRVIVQPWDKKVGINFIICLLKYKVIVCFKILSYF